MTRFSSTFLATPILHCKAKTATQLIFVTVGIPQSGTGFGFYMCKIKVQGRPGLKRRIE
jgi:hypothetical protein